jgi:hypothetical protein
MEIVDEMKLGGRNEILSCQLHASRQVYLSRERYENMGIAVLRFRRATLKLSSQIQEATISRLSSAEREIRERG